MVAILEKLRVFPASRRHTGFPAINLLPSAPTLGRLTSGTSLFLLLFVAEVLVVFMLYSNQSDDLLRGARAVIPILPQEISPASRRITILNDRIAIYKERTAQRGELRGTISDKQLDWPSLLRFIFSSVPDEVKISSVRLSTVSPRVIELVGQTKDTPQLLDYKELLLQSKEFASVAIRATVRRGDSIEFTFDLEASK
ncbi:MAG: hypothetical protein HY666_04980 [Chloroflexi bacterium]|nr:hypothetical protein [Chloroflexota bacterium]